MFDVHNHLVFGVDDGSDSIEETVEMVQQLKDSGYVGAIVTPHYDRGRYVVEADVSEEKLFIIRDTLEVRGIDFGLYPGHEVQIDDRTLADLERGKILPLGRSRYVLSELPMTTTPHYAQRIFYEMQLNGYIPIIAHPERYRYVQQRPDFLLDFIRSGCLVQLNLRSITNAEADGVAARELLQRNMVHMVGTDAHSATWRNGLVQAELQLLKDLVGVERYELLTEENPKRVIDNQYISPEYDQVIKRQEPKKRRSKKKWYQFWR